MKKITRLLVVDDQDLVRSALVALLATQDDFKVVGEATNGAEALALAMKTEPDVALMDISMAVMDGLEATRRLREIQPGITILALTAHDDKGYFFEMLEAGAKGYLTKQSAVDELVMAIRAVAAGHVYLQPALARWLLDDYQTLIKQPGVMVDRAQANESDKAWLETLSPRELQVLELVGEGFTTPRIAEILGTSQKTISRHREKIMNKLNLHSVSELVKFAIRTGLISVKGGPRQLPAEEATPATEE